MTLHDMPVYHVAYDAAMWAQQCCHWTFKNQPRFLKQKPKNPDKETKFKCPITSTINA